MEQANIQIQAPHHVVPVPLARTLEEELGCALIVQQGLILGQERLPVPLVLQDTTPIQELHHVLHAQQAPSQEQGKQHALHVQQGSIQPLEL